MSDPTKPPAVAESKPVEESAGIAGLIDRLIARAKEAATNHLGWSEARLIEQRAELLGRFQPAHETPRAEPVVDARAAMVRSLHEDIFHAEADRIESDGAIIAALRAQNTRLGNDLIRAKAPPPSAEPVAWGRDDSWVEKLSWGSKRPVGPNERSWVPFYSAPPPPDATSVRVREDVARLLSEADQWADSGGFGPTAIIRRLARELRAALAQTHVQSEQAGEK